MPRRLGCQTLRTCPALLVIEDIHWADEATRDLLVFPGPPESATSWAATVETSRDDPLGRGHPLDGILGQTGSAAYLHRVRSRTEPPGCPHGSSVALHVRLSSYHLKSNRSYRA